MYLFRTRPNAIFKQAGAYTTDRRDHTNLFATDLATAKQSFRSALTVTLNPLIIYQRRWKHFYWGRPTSSASYFSKKDQSIGIDIYGGFFS